MIDLALYRYRIGTFSQKVKKNFKFMCYNLMDDNLTAQTKSGRRNKLSLTSWIKIALIVLTAIAVCQADTASSQQNLYRFKFCQTPALTSVLNEEYQIFNWATFLGNFFARYVNGNENGKRQRGVYSMHLNIRSVENKVFEIKNIVKEHSPHFLGLSECELINHANFDQEKLKVPGYNIYFPKSWEQHGYARVLVYYKKTLECSRLPELEDEHLQTIWFKFGFKNSRAGFYCHGYREHKSNLGNSIQSQKEKLNLLISQGEKALCHGNPAEPNEIYILGDMNIDTLDGKWLQRDYSLYSLSQILNNFCNANNMSQLVKTATRVQYNSVANSTSLSCIDHIYTNCKFKCSSPSVTSFGNSDHDIISFVRLSKVPHEPARTIRKRSYKNFDKTLFLEELSKVDWLDVLTCPDLDTAVSSFTSKFRYILNKHAPWTQFQQRKGFSPWITQETKDLIKQREDWKSKAKELATLNRGGYPSSEEIEAWENHRMLRNKINNLKKNDEHKYKKNKTEESVENPSSMWGTVKGFMGWKSAGCPSQIVKNNILYRKAKDVAKHMNEYFIEKVATIKESFENLPVNLDWCRRAMRGKNCKLNLRHVSVRKVLKILKNLKPSKSLGIDEIDSYSLKIAAEIIAEPVHHIVTLSLMQQKFPKAWKYAKVLPLHKKECKLTRKNYRPVSILSPLSKVLEKVVYEQMYEYFSKNKLFHQNLMGYRRNRSTLTAVLQMYDRWVRGASKSKLSAVILLDLSAAFDLVSADKLIQKLEIYGLEPDFLAWVGS